MTDEQKKGKDLQFDYYATELSLAQLAVLSFEENKTAFGMLLEHLSYSNLFLNPEFSSGDAKDLAIKLFAEATIDILREKLGNEK